MLKFQRCSLCHIIGDDISSANAAVVSEAAGYPSPLLQQGALIMG
jgi:hypothetical protein